MAKGRLLLLFLGIPGLLAYGVLVVVQWRAASALTEFVRLQKAYPPDSLKPTVPAVITNKGVVLARAARFAPSDPEPAYQSALFHLGLAESASLYPTDTAAAKEKSLAAGLQESLRRALLAVNRAIALNPGNAEYHFVKATIIQNFQGNLAEGQGQELGRAVPHLLGTSDRLDPYKPSLHFRIGSFWLALGDRDRAKATLTVALSDSYNYARQIFDLLWSSSEDVSEMRALIGDEPIARALLADFLWEKGFKTEAASEYASAARGHPMDYHVAEILVTQHFRTGQYELARGVIRSFVKDSPEIPASQEARILYFMGQSYYLEGRYQEAITEFEHALQIDPGVYYTHQMLAKTYAVTGDYDRAIARYRYLLEKTAESMPPKQQAEIHVELAQAYEKKKQFLQALDQYFRATQLDPLNQAAQQRATELGREHL